MLDSGLRRNNDSAQPLYRNSFHDLWAGVRKHLSYFVVNMDVSYSPSKPSTARPYEIRSNGVQTWPAVYCDSLNKRP